MRGQPSPERDHRLHRFPAFRLRSAFAALVLIAVVPLAVVTTRSALLDRDEVRRDLGQEAGRLVGLAALRHADLVDGGRQLLAGIADSPVILGGGDTCSTRLRDLLATEPRFANAGVADADGALVCAGILPDQSVNFRDRFWFREALSTHRFAVGEYLVGRITGRPSVVFGLPVTDDGQVTAVVWAALDLSWLQQFAARLRLPGKPEVIVTDRNGAVLARYPEADGAGQLSEALEALIRRPGVTKEVTGDDGARRMFATAPLQEEQERGAVVAIGIPTGAAIAAADADLRRNLLGILAAVLVGLAGAWVTADRFVARPAGALLAGARRLAAGDLGARVGPDYVPGELAEVGRAFDEMAAALEARTADLVRAVKERERSETRFRALLESAPDGVVGIDGDLVIRLVNRRAEAMFGYRREELIGQPVAVLTSDADLVRGPVRREICDRLSGAGGPLEITALRKDSSTFPAEVSLASLEIEEETMVSAAVRDVSERAHARAEQERLEAQLEQAQRLESLGRLAGGVAHDFNNRLAVILNYADFVADALPEGSDPVSDGIRDDLAAITRAAQAAADLTRQLLIFGQRDSGRPGMLDLTTAVRAVEPLLTRTLGEDVELQLSLTAGLPCVWADPGRLEQVLMNLAVNARDAMPDGGLLTVTTETVELSPDEAAHDGLRPGPYVRLTVRDTGRGMTPEVAEQAFDPFFTTKPKGEGTGLGLATVFGIVTEAGGRLRLETSPEEGTTISVDLPAAEAASPAPSGEDSTELSGRGETVLVVEDEEPVREMARRILSGAGYTVLTAAGGEEAAALFEQDPGGVDLLLSDVVMPGVSGPELAERLRARRPGLPVLYMSGYSEELVARRRRAGGDVDVLAKPFGGEALLRAVRRVLDHTPEHSTRDGGL